MNRPIEETLHPTTVNEVLLLNRIRELHRQRLMNHDYYNFGPEPKSDYDLVLNHRTHTLHLAAEAYSEVEEPSGTISLTAKTYGNNNKNIGFQQFISAQELAKVNDLTVANLVGHLHERLIRALAHALEEELPRFRKSTLE